MTTQCPELFIYRSSAYYSYDEPLHYFIEKNKFDMFQITCAGSSTCWRGYRGTWHISNSRLYLIDLLDAQNENNLLSVLFPGCEGRVFAYWFSGILKLPYGAQIGGDSFDMLAPEDFEYYHQLEFEEGVLNRAAIVTNQGAGESD